MKRQTTTLSRRQFVRTTASAGLAWSIPATVLKALKKETVKIGIITDLHQDLVPDGYERLFAFMTDMKKAKPDALLQMGDFAYPGDKNKKVIDLFKDAHPKTLHVIGNHDTDSGYTKQQCIDYWGMPGRYYTYLLNGIRLLVLDGNDKGSPVDKKGYPAYIGPEQLAWLKEQLEMRKEPLIIVSHQPLAGSGAVDNAAEIQALLEKHRNKILLAINGHTHIDAHYHLNGVHYVHINSASYYWMGEKYKHAIYDPSIHKQYPYLSYTCPYKDALFTVLTINPVKGRVHIRGKSSQWEGKSPEALNYQNSAMLHLGKEIVPGISEIQW
ncbi:metallophosphoesterase [Niabella sp. CC-SYL272]|uniref:metallophosphoesterase family protein n=1 Tax=Niabella agricola TaxID=2891571 RepID=UPI001F1FC849|nr:metallophosphoesterase [Niabella agricola]MCF3108020.1 metallophosphoesterase [Niabella agricola]